MPPRIALLLCLAFIFWLFAGDLKRRKKVSAAIWIPWLWAAILGSRPVSMWLGSAVEMESQDDYLEGSPLDRNVFLLLMAMGIIVLLRRRVQWSRLFAQNKMLFIFSAFWACSALWSDFSATAFKRWSKDFGNVVMVLVVLTEEDPVDAVKAVLARCTYVLVPISVLFIRYFPDLGRFLTRYTWEMMFTGITLEKNALGNVVMTCWVFLVWDVLDRWERRTPTTKKWEFAGHAALLLMSAWLLAVARSSTSVFCAMVGTGLLLGLRAPLVRKRIRHLEAYAIAGLVLYVALEGAFDLKARLIEGLGRDASLTGRKELWQELIRADIDPVLGEGFYSFWMGDVAQAICDNYYWHPNQAHNGYLDTYLNGGLVGLALLGMFLLAGERGIKKELLRGGRLGSLRLVLFVVTLFVNWTEAMFNKMALAWFVLLLMMVEYHRGPAKLKPAAAGTAGTPPSGPPPQDKP
jgi:O-antigen ligase